MREDLRKIAIHVELEDVPVKFRNLMARALGGEKMAPRSYIKAKCIDCANYSLEEAAGCTVWRCPLWEINPYRLQRIKKAGKAK